MGLLRPDIQRIARFVRAVTKASNSEAVVSETFQVLKRTAKVHHLRVVFSPVRDRWTEWRSSSEGLQIRPHDEWPAPEKRSTTAFFDPDVKHAGFISAGSKSGNIRSVLEVLAPEVWSALLLRSAVDRAQSTSMSESELARATLRARDEERRHIARELHDDLGQSLASLKLELKWTEDRVRRKQYEGVVDELSRVRDTVGVMVERIRDLSHTLHPRILDSLGLVAALKELTRQSTRFSTIRAECSTQGKSRLLGKGPEIALYRCCQEAINNALRHSQASSLMVRICFDRREVRVVVEDDGKGFNPRELYDSNSRMMSSGFWTIRQRMADIGSAFRISTAKGRGTVVEMIVPYSSLGAHDKGKDKSTPRG